MTIDNPLVRRSYTCPLCLDPKDSGLVVCWPCHRQQKMDNNGCYSADAEARIAKVERHLAKVVALYDTP